MNAADAVLPLARAYGRHIDIVVGDDELRTLLETRMKRLPCWTRIYAVFSALFVNRISPPLLLRRWSTFETLSDPERELLLQKLQHSGFPAVRAVFFGVKTHLLAAFYRDRALRGIGYD